MQLIFYSFVNLFTYTVYECFSEYLLTCSLCVHVCVHFVLFDHLLILVSDWMWS